MRHDMGAFESPLCRWMMAASTYPGDIDSLAAQMTTIFSHLSRSYLYPYFRLWNLKLAQCVKPTLKMHGCWAATILSTVEQQCFNIWPGSKLDLDWSGKSYPNIVSLSMLWKHSLVLSRDNTSRPRRFIQCRLWRGFKARPVMRDHPTLVNRLNR